MSIATMPNHSCAVNDRLAPQWSLPEDSDIERQLARESSSTSAGSSLGVFIAGRMFEQDRFPTSHNWRKFLHSSEGKSVKPLMGDLAIQRKKNQKALALLREWLADESGYDERTWPILKKAIEENRLSSRKRFRD
jgi:hypothetical protein